MMFLVSCKTTKVIEKEVYYIPEIDFPEFPKLGDYEKTGGGKIIVDENYFRQLLIFKTQYREMISEYNDKKEVYENGDKENEL